MEQAVLRAAGIVGALGALGGAALYVVRAVRRLQRGFQCLLRSDMMRTYYNRVEEGRLREYEAQNFEMQYAAYKALGGNSFIDKIHEDVQKWEVTR